MQRRPLAVAGCVACLLMVVLMAQGGHAQDTVVGGPEAAVPSQTADPPVSAMPAVVVPEAPPTAHRPLRAQSAAAAPTPTEPRTFNGYPGAPFAVVARKQALVLYPCTQCHAVLPKNPTPRKLVAAPHVADLPHGGGRMWCLDCHDFEDRSRLVGIRGDAIDFDQSHLQCGQCHGNRHRDWWYGGHGKRASGWNEARVVWNCTHCHDPHDPTLAPRAPSPPPPVRAGLARPQPAASASAGGPR
jgi:hypothetical protein